jgi:hypothetical protein
LEELNFVSFARAVDGLADDLGISSDKDPVGSNLEALGRLMSDLAAEQRIAQGIRDDGPPVYEQIPAGWWAHWTLDGTIITHRGQLPADPKGMTIVNSRGSAIRRIVTGRMVIYRPVQISRQLDHSLSSPVPRKSTGGRPTQHDWDNFWIEIVRRALVDGELPDRRTLHRDMLDHIATAWPKQPDESEIRNRLARLYNTPGIKP